MLMMVRSLGLLLSGFTLTGLLLWWHLPGFLCLLTTMLILPTISTTPSQHSPTRSHTPHMPTNSTWHQLTTCCRHGCYPSREWVNWTSSTWWWSLTSGIIGWITQTNIWCALVNTISSIACVYGIHAIISHQADWRWNWITTPLPPQPEVTWTTYWQYDGIGGSSSFPSPSLFSASPIEYNGLSSVVCGHAGYKQTDHDNMPHGNNTSIGNTNGTHGSPIQSSP